MREGGRDSSRKGSNVSIRFDSLKGEITSPKDLLSRLSTLFRLAISSKRRTRSATSTHS